MRSRIRLLPMEQGTHVPRGLTYQGKLFSGTARKKKGYFSMTIGMKKVKIGSSSAP